MALPRFDETLELTAKEREDGYTELAEVLAVRAAAAWLDYYRLRFEGSPDTGGAGSAILEATLSHVIERAIAVALAPPRP